ncbi:MAG: exodeoxyribonuclease V subunit gamma [Pasteurellaceae bacterium]|nr:exodeoxyribonuclease V subunit gamma [Pasteurellaceae bacterium]
MFTVYHSNDLDLLKDLLIQIMQTQPLDDPFQAETILVQSPGMAQWLQMQIALKQGVAANLGFPMPASFLWQQYVDNLPDVELNSQFSKALMTWHLMELMLENDFSALEHYLEQNDNNELNVQQKAYQLARTIADLFDQYLVYRPDWIDLWEQGEEAQVLRQIAQQNMTSTEALRQLEQDIQWQAQLWRALTKKISLTHPANKIQHRAHLYRHYLQKLTQQSPKNLPSRLFIFGIPALPQTYLESLNGISQYCDIHLFFNNPSQEYWGDIIDPAFWQTKQYRLSLSEPEQKKPWLTGRVDLEQTQDSEQLQVGNPLLASWGKLGRDFFYLLSSNAQVADFVFPVQNDQQNLLAQVQQKILELASSKKGSLNFDPADNSLSIHACYSPMREVQHLQDYLLHLFQSDSTITPKDVVVMVADIDKYTPYIQAVFGQYGTKDKRHIPFSISDGKLSENDVLIASFLSLLNLKESQFSAEEILALLDIPAIRANFHISLNQLEQIRYWVEESGIRFGLEQEQNGQFNYNAWQSGLMRLLLGYALSSEQGEWQQSVAFDDSYGLKGELVGALADFIAQLAHWYQKIQQSYSIREWQNILNELIEKVFDDNEASQATLVYLKQAIEQLVEQLEQIHFSMPLTIEVLAQALAEQLDNNDFSVKFLVGKVSFCTLLPMRSIPFKVVCLLGMNETDYPCQQVPVSFDLMQYQMRKGDRSRRNDDRYLFLEAILAAQQYCYISYVGRSLVDNAVREPSVLVSQLLDYLYDNLDEIPTAVNERGKADKKLKPLVCYHPMTAFSPYNFTQQGSFAHHWQPLLHTEALEIADFVVQTETIETIVEPRYIELEQLIRFVKNPVNYFFNNQLGVYFEREDPLIPDFENFTLSGLQRYEFNQHLLNHEMHLERELNNLKLSGYLPRANFAQIYQQQIQETVAEFRRAIGCPLQQIPESESILIPLATPWGTVEIGGEVDRLFQLQDNTQRVSWRVGKLSDNFMIENWLYYLVQVVSHLSQPAPIFYVKEGKQIKGYSFTPIDLAQATEQLVIYVQSFILGRSRLQWVVTQDVGGYLKLISNEPVDLDKCRAKLDDIANGSPYQSGNVYWQRLLEQSQQVDLTKINHQTADWFALMNQSLINVEN